MKIARVLISKEMMEHFLKADFFDPSREIKSNAPKDLEIIGFATSNEYPFTFEAYVKSEEFGDVTDGMACPLIEPFVYTSELVGNNE